MADVVLFANCQGPAVKRLLDEGLPSDFEVKAFSNNSRWGSPPGFDELLAEVSEARLLIMQPLRLRNSAIDPDQMAQLKSSARAFLTFPYIFNSGIAGLIDAREAAHGPTRWGAFGAEPIVELLDAGAGVDDVIERFAGGSIDFDLKRRFARCADEMRRRELGRAKAFPDPTTVRVSRFIDEGFASQRMMLTHNHPTTRLLVEVVRQVRHAAGLPIRMGSLLAIEDENFAGLPGRTAVSPWDARDLGLDYEGDAHWLEDGERIIRKIASLHASAAPRD